MNQFVEQIAAHWKQVPKEMWDYAELGYHETKNSTLLQMQLRSAGFTLSRGINYRGD